MVPLVVYIGIHSCKRRKLEYAVALSKSNIIVRKKEACLRLLANGFKKELLILKV